MSTPLSQEPVPPAQNAWFNRLLPLAVFTSAWLLFQVQPMVAKRLLPWFGGGTAIWTTAMLFFQAALFAGYLYAHVLGRRFSPRGQVVAHGLMLAAAVVLIATVRVVPDEQWIPTSVERPALQILVTLAACVGLPFTLLAATAPLSQVWFARANPGQTPYRLYALSNAGSLAALLSYPFVVEPNLGLERQGLVWTSTFGIFAVLLVASGFLSLRANEAPLPAPPETTAENPARRGPNEASKPQGARSRPLEQFLWLALPACASLLLLAVTTFLCQDVASIPLLWIAPMVIYLLSFILTFESDRWYHRWPWLAIMATASFAMVMMWRYHETMGFILPLAANLIFLLAACMVCHGELAAMRPSAERLTAFYLSLSAGGAIGGLLAAVVAPLVFVDHVEFPVAVAAMWALSLAVVVTDRGSPLYRGRPVGPLIGILLLYVTLIGIMAREVANGRQYAVAMARNFYGSLKVREIAGEYENIAHYKLTNGSTSHGAQLRRPDRRRIASSYYYPLTGIGQIVAPMPEKPRRLGVVGLGSGTLAAYAHAGDVYRFYEINPQVIDFAEKYFTYLPDARERGATIEIVEGDARLQLQHESPQEYDLLALDAFNSDSIPSHLLTLEAFEIYLRHVKTDGILAVHVSNRYLDLSMVVKAATRHFSLDNLYIAAHPDPTPTGTPSVWVLVARPEAKLAERARGISLEDESLKVEPVLWTDDRNNIIDILYMN
jgi:SAM-dependent methyltransferase